MDRYLVDGMNVIGARPDGWWRDLDTAVLRLAGVDLGRVQVAFPGKGRTADDEIVRRVGIDPDPSTWRVVTSDRPLAERVRAAGAGDVMGAGTFRRLLDG